MNVDLGRLAQSVGIVKDCEPRNAYTITSLSGRDPADDFTDAELELVNDALKEWGP